MSGEIYLINLGIERYNISLSSDESAIKLSPSSLTLDSVESKLVVCKI